MSKAQGNGGSSSSGGISDARFASFETDHRFRLPSRKYTKTTLDKRFAGVLNDEEFTATAKVDRYGRKIQSDAKKKALERLYRAEEDSDVDEEELVQRELRAAHDKATQKKHDPARQGGFASSDSDSDDDADDVEHGGAGLASPRALHRTQDQQSDVESGEVTRRLAIVNLDWDHVNSTDLIALFSSFLPPSSGRILKISVYTSEFGKERMQQEETQGPPKALFKGEARADGSSDNSDSDSDQEVKKELIQEGDDQDFDSDVLRSYQLDRLRYYYAVMVCSSPDAAKHIYEATDGTEYQSSSNVIDLRFVPDDVAFDNEARDECAKVPDSYKPVDFVTNALQSSKVKLTWDMHPEEASRKESIHRAFSGGRGEMEENDLRAYLASDNDGEEDDAGESRGDGDTTGEPTLTKKELARKKMREALGLAAEDTARPGRAEDGPVGGMQITFAPALAERKAKEPGQEETTIDKYRRKERERKERKRQAAKARREGGDGDEGEVAGDDAGLDDALLTADGDAGFDDPFFTADGGGAAQSKTSRRKEERRRAREAREAAEAESADQAARLTAAMAGGTAADEAEHFDMKQIERAEKEAGKKGRRRKKEGETGSGRVGLQQGFEMDVGDDRFHAVFDSHEFAIDPSNPKFKTTGGMKKLLEEGRKKRRAADTGEAARGGGRTSKRAKGGGR